MFIFLTCVLDSANITALAEITSVRRPNAWDSVSQGALAYMVEGLGFRVYSFALLWVARPACCLLTHLTQASFGS